MAKSMVRLSDEQRSTILRAGFALEPPARKLLRDRVIEKLEAAPEIGDGLTYRVCCSIQCQLFTPPPDLPIGPRQLNKIR